MEASAKNNIHTIKVTGHGVGMAHPRIKRSLWQSVVQGNNFRGNDHINVATGDTVDLSIILDDKLGGPKLAYINVSVYFIVGSLQDGL